MKKLIYASFNEFSDDGLGFYFFDEDMKDWLEQNSPEYLFVKEVELPEIDKSKITEMGVKHIEEEIKKLTLLIS